ncbi:MAG: alpha/beta fold hydrolase [Syntrophorhabdaceae bacterium]
MMDNTTEERPEIIEIPSDNSTPLSVTYFPANGRIPVIMLHGLQSHTGWFSQSARFLSRLGHPVYGLDRRGSGRSSAPRGDIEHYEQFIEDIRVLGRYIAKERGIDKVHILGHCFGAMPALALACRYPGLALSLILTSPGLYTYTDLTLTRKMRVFLSRITSQNPYLPVPLRPEDFTDDPAYQAYIAEDPKALREASAHFWFAVWRMRRYIKQKKQGLTHPIFAAFAARDQVSNTRRNLEFLCGLPSGTRWFTTYERSLHILEFGLDRDLFFRDLALWLQRF